MENVDKKEGIIIDFTKSKDNVIFNPNINSKTAKEIDETSETENLKKVEAVLFLSARFSSIQELVGLTDINPLMLKELLNRLIEKYNKEDSAIEIIERNDMFKMDVRKEYFNMINRLATGKAEFSKAEQETLAVITYKQPVKQSVVVNIRGNKAYEHIKKFIETGLVIPKVLGHTLELKLSDDFFEYFHVNTPEEAFEPIKENEGEG
jgi:segregation and condensation protein B